MANKLTDLKIDILSYSCVIVWPTIIKSIPQINSELAKGLFDNPTQTTVHTSSQGIIVTEVPVMSPMNVDGVVTVNLPIGVFPRMSFGTQIYNVFDKNLDRLVSIHDWLTSEFNKSNPDFLKDLKPSQLGINLEYELLLKDDFIANEWFKEKMFKDVKSDLINSFSPIDFRFVLADSEFEKLTVSIQPRFNKKNSLFLSINHHYGVPPLSSFSSGAQIKELIDLTIKKIGNELLPFLLSY